MIITVEELVLAVYHWQHTVMRKYSSETPSTSRRHFGSSALCVTLLLAAVTRVCGAAALSEAPVARNGEIDLRNHDFEAVGAVDLDGQWDFAWQEFTDPVDGSAEYPLRLTVPNSWNGAMSAQGEIPGEGHGTYRLTVLLPEESSRLALRILDVATAIELFVDGNSVYRAGTPGASPETTTPEYRSAVVRLGNIADTMTIVAHVSNYNYRLGGIWESIQLGDFDALGQLRERLLLKDALLFGSILIIGLYHLTLFLFRRDRSILAFGVFCLIIAIRIAVTGERYLVHLLPGMPWEMVPRLEYLSFYLAVPVFLFYLTRTFERESNRVPVAAAMVVCTIFVLLVVVTPARFFTYTLTPFQVLTVLVGAYGLLILFRASRANRTGAKSMFVGFAVFFATVLNDILYAAEVIHTFHVVSIGLLGFIFIQSANIARVFNLDFIIVKRQTAALREANEIINSSPSVAFRWRDEAGWPVEFASENVQTLLGYSADEISSPEFRYESLIHPDDIDRFRREVAGFPRGPGWCQEVHEPYRLICKDGSVRWVSNKTFVERDAYGRVVSYRGIVEDVSELKEATEEIEAYREHLEELVTARTRDLEIAKKEAEAASTAKSRFLASMSHEFRTPLNHIIGFTSLVSQNRVGPVTEEQAEYLHDALSSANHLHGLINEVLDVAKVESGTLELDVSPVRLAELVDSVVKPFAGTAGTHDIVVPVRDNGVPEVVQADETRLRQVLINLLSNAVKFSPDGSRIAVSVQSNVDAGGRRSVMFSVSDEGIGIDPVDQDRIFESFEQIDIPSHGTAQGTGLGLAICKSLVELHGGRIWVDSEGSGTGATFHFTLPFDDSETS